MQSLYHSVIIFWIKPYHNTCGASQYSGISIKKLCTLHNKSPLINKRRTPLALDGHLKAISLSLQEWLPFYVFVQFVPWLPKARLCPSILAHRNIQTHKDASIFWNMVHIQYGFNEVICHAVDMSSHLKTDVSTWQLTSVNTKCEYASLAFDYIMTVNVLLSLCGTCPGFYTQYFMA